MQQTLPWILASLSLVLLVAAAALWLLHQRRPRVRPLPSEWTLTARPVFSSDERRVYRQLREALPHHIVLSKLPLVRFSQPTDPERGALLVRTAGLAQRHLRHLQRQRSRAGGHRPRQRPRRLAPHDADQAVGACRLPRALPALPGGPPAVHRRAAADGAANRRRRGARATAGADRGPGACPDDGRRGRAAARAHDAVAGLGLHAGLVLRRRGARRRFRRAQRLRQPALRECRRARFRTRPTTWAVSSSRRP